MPTNSPRRWRRVASGPPRGAIARPVRWNQACRTAPPGPPIASPKRIAAMAAPNSAACRTPSTKRRLGEAALCRIERLTGRRPQDRDRVCHRNAPHSRRSRRLRELVRRRAARRDRRCRARSPAGASATARAARSAPDLLPSRRLSEIVTPTWRGNPVGMAVEHVARAERRGDAGGIEAIRRFQARRHAGRALGNCGAARLRRARRIDGRRDQGRQPRRAAGDVGAVGAGDPIASRPVHRAAASQPRDRRGAAAPAGSRIGSLRRTRRLHSTTFWRRATRRAGGAPRPPHDGQRVRSFHGSTTK